MWVQNVAVSGAGRTVALTGAIFADNANIALVEASNGANVAMLRFAKVDDPFLA
jgi:hypothetical protein